MGRSRKAVVAQSAIGAAVVAALLTGVADAKMWKKWAPEPLASDSSYGALQARPSDSLTASQLSWLSVQRDWREQRKVETPGSSTSITWSGHEHPARPSDKRFAALASQPYAALADTDRAWLVAENAAQQVAREKQASGSGPMGIFLAIVIVGALAAIAAYTYAASQTYGPF